MENYKKEYQTAQVIAKEMTAGLIPKEQIILQGWLSKAEENKELYKRIKSGKSRKVRNEYVSRIKMGKAWDKLKVHIAPQRKTIALKTWIARIAAVLIIGFFSGTLYYIAKNTILTSTQVTEAEIQPGSSKALLLLDNGEAVRLELEENDSIVEADGTLISNSEGQLAYSALNTTETIYNVIKVPRGGEYQLILSDGTKVWLNSDSEIKYPVQFNQNNRKVWAKGEVYFDVERDESNPFLVNVNDIEVEVLGTEFNIEAYPENESVITTLVEGSIKLKKAKDELIIEPDQQVITSTINDGFTVRQVNAKNHSLWKDGIFYCEAEHLSTIMEKLSRWYNVNIFYLNSSLKDKRFSVEVQRYENIDEVLNILSATNKVRFEINSNNIIVME